MNCDECPHVEKIKYIEKEYERLSAKLEESIQNNEISNKEMTKNIYEINLTVKDINSTTKLTQNDMTHFTQAVEKTINSLDKRLEKNEKKTSEMELEPATRAKSLTLSSIAAVFSIIASIVINWLFNK